MSRSRSSWHSLSRSPWHSMALQRRCPTSCSPVHVLTHVFSSARFFTCCAWLRVVWLYPTPLAPLPSARCACRGCCLQAGRELRHAVFVATLVRRWEHLVAGACASKVCTLRLSSGFALLGFPRSFTVVLSSPPGLVPEVIPCRRSARVCSEHLRVVRSWFVAMVWLSPASASGLQSRRSSVVATLRSCRRCGCVPRGQRALLDADMLELIDQSACLVEPVSCGVLCSSRACAVTPQQARPAPRPVAAREFPLREASWKVFCSLGCSLRAAPVASLRLLDMTEKSWMIWSFHCFVMWSTSCAS